jgi:hypothetical protein
MNYCYVCLKWGTKYSAEYVNKLASMIRRWDPHGVPIYCYTDDATNIDASINIIPITKDYQAWWLKLPLLIEPALEIHETKILFDLDIIIHNTISDLHTYAHDSLVVCKSLWKHPAVLNNKSDNDTLYNSSVMIWKNAEYVWNAFSSDPERFMSVYKGIDRFLWNEGITVDTLPPNLVYSYRQGATLNDVRPFVKRDDYKIALFHGVPKQTDLPKDDFVIRYWNEL